MNQVETEKLLDQGLLPDRYLIAGDFNAKHWSWQPSHRGDTHSHTVAGWVEANGLGALLVGEPTRDSGQTIDLVFTDLPGESRVNRSLDSGSDHYTIETTLTAAISPAMPEGTLRVPDKALLDFSQIVGSNAGCLNGGELCDAGALNSLAEKLVQIFQRAKSVAGKKKHQVGRSYP